MSVSEQGMFVFEQNRICHYIWPLSSHRCFLGSIWLQWILTVPNDHGNWENQYEIRLTWFHWANFEICLSQDFKRVLKKYLMPRSRMTFDPIFGIFGIFYDLCYPLFDQKVPIYGWNIVSKLHFFDVLRKMQKTGG